MNDMFRIERVSIPLITNPSFHNPQDATLNLQAAMKNLQTISFLKI